MTDDRAPRRSPNIADAPVRRDGIVFHSATGGGSTWRVRGSAEHGWQAWEQASPWRVLGGDTLAEISAKLAVMTDRGADG